MTSPERTPTRRWRTLALAAALLLAALVQAGPATAQVAEPPPVSCIADNPVDPLGPGFLLNRGKFTTINHPDAVLETAPYGINNRGQIVGGYDTAGFAVHGFVLDRGRYTTIDVPGASRTIALRINARRQVLGDYEDARGGCHGYLLDNGRFTTIDVPGAPTQALGLNDRGQVVGFYLDTNQVRHGFLFKNGAYTTIDHPLASSDSQAHDLNDRGQIVGLYERVAGQAREGASRSRGDPTRAEAIEPARSPLTSWWTASGAAGLR